LLIELECKELNKLIRLAKHLLLTENAFECFGKTVSRMGCFFLKKRKVLLLIFTPLGTDTFFIRSLCWRSILGF
jgi:hypothetical protein